MLLSTMAIMIKLVFSLELLKKNLKAARIETKIRSKL